MNVLLIANNKKLEKKAINLIAKLSEQPKQFSSCIGPKEAKKWLEANDAPDLIFNIGEDNIEEYFALYHSVQIRSALVFITDNDKYMGSSFLFNTLHFIADDWDIADIKFCFDKHKTYFKDQSEVSYVRDLQKLMDLMAKKDKEYKKRFMVKVGNVIKSVNVADIAYFYSSDGINYLVKYNAKKFPVDTTLDEAEDMLNPATFFRANRQFIININCIAEIHPYFKGRVKLNLDPQQDSDLIISAEKSRSFKDWLDE